MRGMFTLLIALLALLPGSSLLWGQQGIGVLLPEYKDQVESRREDGNSTH